jgi:hypothetical protein
MTRLAVQFDDHVVRRILGVSVHDDTPIDGANLSSCPRQPMCALDAPKVRLLEKRLNAFGRLSQDPLEDPAARQLWERVQLRQQPCRCRTALPARIEQ